MLCRRAAPGPAAPGTPLPRRRPRPRRPAAPGKAPPCGPERPHVRPRRPRPGKRPAPGKGPRWPGNAAVAAAQKHSAVCAARAPGRPRRRKHSWPRPAPPAAPRRCAAPPPASPGRPRPRTPIRQTPRRPPGWPSPRGVPPGGSQSLGATCWRPRPPLTQKKPQSNRGLTPPGKDGEADGQGWHCPGWTACRLRAKE